MIKARLGSILEGYLRRRGLELEEGRVYRSRCPFVEYFPWTYRDSGDIFEEWSAVSGNKTITYTQRHLQNSVPCKLVEEFLEITVGDELLFTFQNYAGENRGTDGFGGKTKTLRKAVREAIGILND